jgi:tight adherence protein B
MPVTVNLNLGQFLSNAVPIHLKLLGVALLWVGVATFLFFSATKGLLHRLGGKYAANLDVDLRSMFMAERGASIGWLQVTSSIAVVALSEILHIDALWGVALAIVVLPRAVISMMVRRRRTRVDNQANGFALALANTLKTTASVGDAVRLTLDVTSRPLKDELETALREVRVGSTLEEALLAMAARSGSPALDVVVSALLIGQKTGGDLPRILESTATSLRELKRLEELTDRVTRSAKQSLAVAACITAGLAIMLPRVMPGFFDPLKNTTKGQLIALQCFAVYSFAVFLGWRFTRKSI